jgi:predicted Zn-dependent protease
MYNASKLVNHPRWKQWRLFLLLALFVVGASLSSLGAESVQPLKAATAKPHPLPQTLAQWNGEAATTGHYFDRVRPLAVGALIWSKWPIRVYIESPPAGTLIKPEVWQAAIAQAVRDWQPYLPLQLVKAEAEADIQISATPPRQKSGARVRSAETRYEIYVGERQTLSHRVSVYIRPSQTPQYIAAAARHELGHALGIWGHSPNSDDVMYFAQVKAPPAISKRDINTLVQIYQQPTQLGWPVEKSS